MAIRFDCPLPLITEFHTHSLFSQKTFWTVFLDRASCHVWELRWNNGINFAFIIQVLESTLLPNFRERERLTGGEWKGKRGSMRELQSTESGRRKEAWRRGNANDLMVGKRDRSSSYWIISDCQWLKGWLSYGTAEILPNFLSVEGSQSFITNPISPISTSLCLTHAFVCNL